MDTRSGQHTNHNIHVKSLNINLGYNLQKKLLLQFAVDVKIPTHFCPIVKPVLAAHVLRGHKPWNKEAGLTTSCWAAVCEELCTDVHTSLQPLLVHVLKTNHHHQTTPLWLHSLLDYSMGDPHPISPTP